MKKIIKGEFNIIRIIAILIIIMIFIICIFGTTTNKNILHQQFIEKWSGQLQSVMSE